MPVGLAQWGDVKDLAEAAVGRDPITGELLQPWERWKGVEAAGVGPYVNGKALGKTDDIVKEINEIAGKVNVILQAIK